MPSHARLVGICCLSVILALYVVGAVSHGVLRHMAQTLPLWIPVALGLRQSPQAKWAALPCLLFWLGIMSLIWLFLLHVARIVSGTFTPTEIAMTIVVGVASIAGLWTLSRWHTSVQPLTAAFVVVLTAALQLLAFRISLLPGIARR